MAHTISGAASTPATHSRTSVQVSKVATWSISCLAPSSPCSALQAASTGTKAWLKAPSPSTLRNRLGIRKATLKAAVMALTPNTEAINRSRTRPVTREARVSRETVEEALNKDTAGVYSPHGRSLRVTPCPPRGRCACGPAKPAPRPLPVEVLPAQNHHFQPKPPPSYNPRLCCNIHRLLPRIKGILIWLPLNP